MHFDLQSWQRPIAIAISIISLAVAAPVQSEQQPPISPPQGFATGSAPGEASRNPPWTPIPIGQALPSPSRPQPVSVITVPSWARSPQPEFPAIAAANGVGSGRVTLRCSVARSGAVSGCTILEEVPVGQGFGESAISATELARLDIRHPDHLAPDAKLQVTVRFELAD